MDGLTSVSNEPFTIGQKKVGQCVLSNSTQRFLIAHKTDATERVFPNLDLFTGWGIHGQNYEGQILKQVMLEGIKKDIVCLPVHDAVAVQQEHLKWAEEIMLECWDKQMETSGLERVKVDLP